MLPACQLYWALSGWHCISICCSAMIQWPSQTNEESLFISQVLYSLVMYKKSLDKILLLVLWKINYSKSDFFYSPELLHVSSLKLENCLHISLFWKSILKLGSFTKIISKDHHYNLGHWEHLPSQPWNLDCFSHTYLSVCVFFPQKHLFCYQQVLWQRCSQICNVSSLLT